MRDTSRRSEVRRFLNQQVAPSIRASVIEKEIELRNVHHGAQAVQKWIRAHDRSVYKSYPSAEENHNQDMDNISVLLGFTCSVIVH